MVYDSREEGVEGLLAGEGLLPWDPGRLSSRLARGCVKKETDFGFK